MDHVLLSDLVHQACLLEARARKPGNVHPDASFEDLTYGDFVLAAQGLAETIPFATEWGIGQTVLRAVQRTQVLVNRPTNPNLGIILLLTPLATVPPSITLKDGIDHVLESLTIDDARLVYQAIGLAKPGGMGKVETADVTQVPAISLLDAMRLAAERDAIASEYASGFQIVLGTGVPFLHKWWGHQSVSPIDVPWHYARTGVHGESVNTPQLPAWEAAIIHLQLTLMSHHPDTLIARKCGINVAAEAARQATEALDAGGLRSPQGRKLICRLDDWLRAEGHRRNPGTTADLIAASLFAAARDGMIEFRSQE